MDGTIDVVPSSMSGTLKYPTLTCEWSYSAPMLIVFDGYSDTEISGNAFHFVCDSPFSCGRYACVTYMLDKTCYDDKGNVNELNSQHGRVTRGCVFFDIEGYD